MKKVISMLLVLLLMLVAITGCGQNKGNNEVSGNTDTNVENTVDNGNTANEKKPQNTQKNDGNTELFGIPQKTEEYTIRDLSDPQNEYIVERNNGKIFGMEGFLITGKEIKEGEYAEGSGFFIWAQNGAFVIKGINYIDEVYHITLEKVEKGTPQSHKMLYILAKKPFKGQFIRYTDGKDLLNLTLLDKEVGLERVQGEFQKVDLKNNTIDIIPPGSTLVKTYTMVNVPPEMLEGLQKDDVIEYMRGDYNDTVYAVRKVEN